MKSVEFLIIGGGPTGLGAAHRLNELGHKNWLLLEQSNRLGGLASSEIDDQGFVWDLGGHVLFSHYEYFDSLLSQLLKDEGLNISEKHGFGCVTGGYLTHFRIIYGDSLQMTWTYALMAYANYPKNLHRP